MRWFAGVLLLLASSVTQVRAGELIMLAAASLADVMQDIGPLYAKASGTVVRFNFAASSTLARQLEQGSPGNLFASADEQWMDWSAQRNLIAADTRTDLLGNALVLVMPKELARPVVIDRGLDLAALLGADGRIATGDPSNVPAGIYAKQALTNLGLWGVASPRIAASDSVRSALLLVERHEAPLGIVYATDAAVAPNVAVVGIFPETSHTPIIYPFAVTRAGDSAEARSFLAFLKGPQSGAAFTKRGFTVLATP